jgi:hypothetical protein
LTAPRMARTHRSWASTEPDACQRSRGVSVATFKSPGLRTDLDVSAKVNSSVDLFDLFVSDGDAAPGPILGMIDHFSFEPVVRQSMNHDVFAGIFDTCASRLLDILFVLIF